MAESKEHEKKKKNVKEPTVDPVDIINEKNSKLRDQKYNEYVKNVTPTHNPVATFFQAYLVGGIICVIGQGLFEWYRTLGLEKDDALLYSTLSLIFLSVLLTGLNIYPKLAKFGGAGCVVPITGFANSVASPAIEFKKEGQVFGIGCKIFTIAGPVILYGVFSSWVLGVIYYLSQKLF